ncbi:MAG: ribosome assembly RNA-binding protein YhbY [Chromatiales bacterium]|jgi:RNA-binding protein|nr:ribosome assembly RNA-binding protein YhbY [Chromatiales bacterium]
MKERRQLQARAHALKPVVTVGGSGLRESVVAEVESALTHHELIKVKLPALAREDRAAIAAQLVATCEATLVQTVGRIIVLYKRRPDDETLGTAASTTPRNNGPTRGGAHPKPSRSRPSQLKQPTRQGLTKRASTRGRG